MAYSDQITSVTKGTKTVKTITVVDIVTLQMTTQQAAALGYVLEHQVVRYDSTTRARCEQLLDALRAAGYNTEDLKHGKQPMHQR